MLNSYKSTLSETTPIVMLWMVKDPSDLSKNQLPLPDNENFPYKQRLFNWADQETQRKIKLYYFSKNLTKGQKQQLHNLSNVEKGGRENVEIIDFNARFEKNHDLNFLNNPEVPFAWKIDIMRLIMLLEDAPAIYFDFDILPMTSEKDLPILVTKQIKEEINTSLSKQEMIIAKNLFKTSSDNEIELLNEIKNNNKKKFSNIITNLQTFIRYKINLAKRRTNAEQLNIEYISNLIRSEITSNFNHHVETAKSNQEIAINVLRIIILNELINPKKISSIETNPLGYKMAVKPFFEVKQPTLDHLENSIIIANNKNNPLISGIYNAIKKTVLNDNNLLKRHREMSEASNDFIYHLHLKAVDVAYSLNNQELIKLEERLQNCIKDSTVNNFSGDHYKEKCQYFGFGCNSNACITEDHSWEEKEVLYNNSNNSKNNTDNTKNITHTNINNPLITILTNIIIGILTAIRYITCCYNKSSSVSSTILSDNLKITTQSQHKDLSNSP